MSAGTKLRQWLMTGVSYMIPFVAAGGILIAIGFMLHDPVDVVKPSLQEALEEVTRKRMGMTAVIDSRRRVVGIFTDGDLRRTLAKVSDIGSLGISEVMSRNPSTIRTDQLAVEAVKLMEERKVNQLLVVDPRNRLVGALNMHDLFRAKAL